MHVLSFTYHVIRKPAVPTRAQVVIQTKFQEDIGTEVYEVREPLPMMKKIRKKIKTHVAQRDKLYIGKILNLRRVVYQRDFPVETATELGHAKGPRIQWENYHCCFCRDEFKDGDRTVLLKCGHRFHSRQQATDDLRCGDYVSVLAITCRRASCALIVALTNKYNACSGCKETT